MKSRSLAVSGFAVAGVVAVAAGQSAAFTIDGAVAEFGTPHDAFPSSVRSITDNISTTGELIIDEHTYGSPDLGAPFFATRHNAWLSSDGGSTAHAFQNQDNFSISFDITLDAVNLTPRKEAGLVFSHPTTGEGLMIFVSDNGEIATFGGFFPFTCNLCGGTGDYGGTAYTVGTTRSVQVVYRAGVGSTAGADLVKPASLEFIVDGITAGVRYLGNLENGMIDGTEIGFYMQSQPNAINLASEANTSTYQNVSAGTLLDGDLNADGFVGIADLNIVLGAWNESQDPIAAEPTFLSDLRADPTNDNFVGIADLNVVLGNWNAGTPPTTAVPEPAGVALIGAAGLALCRRRLA